MTPIPAPWRIGIDIGGTFTDLVLIAADGRIVTHKTPSNPLDPSEALFRGLGELAQRVGLSIESLCARTAHFVHGTTVATNTLLERNGARIGLLVTAGFRDTLELRRGQRENVWDHRTPWAPVLVPRYLRRPVRERVGAQGEVLTALDTSDIEAAAEVFRRESVAAVGICFLHAYGNPRHEQQAQALLEKLLPDVFVCASHAVAPIVGEYERSSTVAVNAYIANRVVPYLRRVRDRLRTLGLAHEPYFVQSSGGVISFAQLQSRPAVLALSGPAAGANSLRAYAGALGAAHVVSIEVGGTSCDVTVMENTAVAERTSFRIGDDVIALPAVDIHTVALGGGTIAGVDGAGLLFVGPRAAGARPGPAAFGLGGTEPTVTDAHVVLGRLRSGKYAGGALTLDASRAAEAIHRRVAQPLKLDVEAAAAAIVRLGEQQIRHAVERVTLERGLDPAQITLLAGGGAGPLHAAAAARAVGCKRVFVPRLAGVFCAFGMCNAQVRHDSVKEIGRALDTAAVTDIAAAIEALTGAARERFEADGFGVGEVACSALLDMRYFGQQGALAIPLPALDVDAIRAAFEARHLREFGFIQPGGSIEVAAARLIASARLGDTNLALNPHAESEPRVDQRRVWIDPQTGFAQIPAYDGATLAADTEIIGPALIEDAAATTLIGNGDRLRVDAAGNLHIDIAGARA